MAKRKRMLLAAIFSLILTAVSGIVGGFPLRFLQPVVCIQMIGANCPPFTIHWASFLGDFIFWLIIITIGFTGMKIFSAAKGKEAELSKLNLVFLIAIFILIFCAVIISFTRKNSKFCGGIAANLPEFQCPTGYICKLDRDYPDAGGSCIFILDIFGLLF